MNKVDRLYNWNSVANSPIQDAFARQEEYVRKEFEDRLNSVRGRGRARHAAVLRRITSCPGLPGSIALVPFSCPGFLGCLAGQGACKVESQQALLAGQPRLPVRPLTSHSLTAVPPASPSCRSCSS